MQPSWTTLSNILPRASMSKTNGKGDKRSPCLNPLELSKKPKREPLIKIEKRTVDRQKKIHYLHLSENPLRSSNFIRKPQNMKASATREPKMHVHPRQQLQPKQEEPQVTLEQTVELLEEQLAALIEEVRRN